MGQKLRLEQCRVYLVTYTAIGREAKTLTRIKKCVVAIDVADVVRSIHQEVLGAEITEINPDGNLEFHEVVERVEIESTELVGRLHGISDTAYSIITSYGDNTPTS